MEKYDTLTTFAARVDRDEQEDGLLADLPSQSHDNDDADDDGGKRGINGTCYRETSTSFYVFLEQGDLFLRVISSGASTALTTARTYYVYYGLFPLCKFFPVLRLKITFQYRE